MTSKTCSTRLVSAARVCVLVSNGLNPRTSKLSIGTMPDEVRRTSDRNPLSNELPLVQVDAVLIEQALGQILDNACKYPHPDHYQDRRTAGPRHIVVSVADEGLGLAPNEKARLGERSSREPSSCDHSGSGLGLWIASALWARTAVILRQPATGKDLDRRSPSPYHSRQGFGTRGPAR